MVEILGCHGPFNHLMYFLLVRVVFGSCLPQDPRLSQWQVLYHEFPCAIRSQTLHAVGVRLVGPELYFFLLHVS